MNAKQLYESLTESKRQEMAENIVRHEVFICQSSLVDHLLSQQADGFDYDNIENLYLEPDNDEARSHDDLELQEIYEWWTVSEWLVDKLRAQNEPILSNDYGTWWGRTCTGQSICLDYNIQMLACELEADIQNQVNKVRSVGL